MTGAVHESALDSGPVGVGRHDRRERPSFLQEFLLCSGIRLSRLRKGPPSAAMSCALLLDSNMPPSTSSTEMFAPGENAEFNVAQTLFAFLLVEPFSELF
jgi:hypothetical protein